MITEKTGHRERARNQTGLITCLLLTIVVVILYRHVGGYEFVRFDDNLYVTQNQMVQSGITAEGIRWAFSINEQLYWHPLTWLSHMLDCQLFGLNAGWHHITSLVLHICSCLLLFLILRTMTGSTWCSACVALLFGIHPINIESVAWVSSRKNVLSTFFWLLTMAGYALYCQRPSRARYWLTLATFALGLMAKPILVTLPCVLLLLDYWPLNRISLPGKWRPPYLSPLLTGYRYHPDHSPWHIILEKIPFFLLSGLAIFFSVVAVRQLGIDVSFQSVPLGVRISNALVSYWAYIRQLIWPTHLAFFYPFPTTIPLWKPVISGIFLMATLGLAIRFARLAPYFLVGWLWFLGTLVPTIGILQAGLWPATADRFAYVPSIGIFILAVWGARTATTKCYWLTPVRGGAVAAIIIATYIMAADRQIKTWQSSSALFINAIANTNNNFLAYHNLGNVYLDAGEIEKAIAQYHMALKADPKYIEAYNSLAAALLKQNKINLAIKYFKKATDLNPSNAIYRRNYNSTKSLKHYLDGKTAMEEQRYTDALTSLNQSLEINAQFPKAIRMRAEVNYKMKNYEQTIEDYQDYLAFDPKNQAVHLQIARLYAVQGQPERSADWLQRAILNGFNDWDSIKDEASYINLKDTKPFLDLMNRYEGLQFGPNP